MDDPRTSPDFKSQFYPRCEGGAAPPATDPSPTSRRKLALLAACYEINLCYQQLLAARKTSGVASTQETAALQDLEKALVHRDQLEDEFAPYGIVTNPQVDNGIITNLTFTLPVKGPPGRSSLSMTFTVPVRSQRS